MDTNEQMYGVAELLPTSKGLQSRTGHVVQLPTPSHKLKKKHKVEGGKMERSIQEDVGVMAKRKKASVRPYQAMSSARNSTNDQWASLLVKHDVTSPSTCNLHTSSHTTGNHSSSAHSSSTVQQSAAEQGSSNAMQSPVANSKAKKKVKKQKKRGVGEIESGLEPPKPLIEAPPIVIKPRPEALSIPATAGTPVQSDAPDTGDVRHMLHELLHPPPVSLVTPIPTPNTVKPFVFPTQPSVSLCVSSSTIIII